MENMRDKWEFSFFFSLGHPYLIPIGGIWRLGEGYSHEISLYQKCMDVIPP